MNHCFFIWSVWNVVCSKSFITMCTGGPLSFYEYKSWLYFLQETFSPPSSLIGAEVYISFYFNSFQFILCDISWHISCLCYWGPELKNCLWLEVKRKLRKRSITAGKYSGCSSYYLNLGPWSLWSNISTFIKCFPGASMAKIVVGKWFRLHRRHLDQRLLQLELLRRISLLLKIILHVTSWTLYNKVLN